MPWKETGPVLERTRFIEDYLSGFFTITELAARYHVSRRTLHKWLARHDVDGARGLADRPRTPLHSPQQTDHDVVAKIIAFRKRFPFMGPRKIIARLAELHPRVEWPAASTAGDILRRADLVTPRRRRNPPAHPLRARAVAVAPNDLMTVDYKGQFLLGNHQYCYPLTIVDHVSRYLLACDAFLSTEQGHTRRVFERVFREHGLPRAILSDKWQSLRISRAGAAFPTFALVDSPRYQRRAHRPGTPRAERCPRADAPHAQSADHAASGGHTQTSASAIRPIH